MAMSIYSPHQKAPEGESLLNEEPNINQKGPNNHIPHIPVINNPHLGSNAASNLSKLKTKTNKIFFADKAQHEVCKPGQQTTQNKKSTVKHVTKIMSNLNPNETGL